MAGKTLGEGPEAPVRIDVVNHECAPWSHACPGPVQFKAYVVFTVHAVVNKKIDLTKSGKQLRKSKPARSLDVGPTICKAARDCHADLRVPGSLYRRKVNAGQMAAPVSPERLKNKARCETVSHTGLDDIRRSQVTGKAPDRPHKSGISVIPRSEALRPRTYSF